jgi:hypothetical protein
MISWARCARIRKVVVQVQPCSHESLVSKRSVQPKRRLRSIPSPSKHVGFKPRVLSGVWSLSDYAIPLDSKIQAKREEMAAIPH